MDGITSNQSTVVSHIRQNVDDTGTFNNFRVSTLNAEATEQVRQVLTDRLANTPTRDGKARKILADALANLSQAQLAMIGWIAEAQADALANLSQAQLAMIGWIAEAQAELDHCNSARHPIPKPGAQPLSIPAKRGHVPE